MSDRPGRSTACRPGSRYRHIAAIDRHVFGMAVENRRTQPMDRRRQIDSQPEQMAGVQVHAQRFSHRAAKLQRSFGIIYQEPRMHFHGELSDAMLMGEFGGPPPIGNGDFIPLPIPEFRILRRPGEVAPVRILRGERVPRAARQQVDHGDFQLLRQPHRLFKNPMMLPRNLLVRMQRIALTGEGADEQTHLFDRFPIAIEILPVLQKLPGVAVCVTRISSGSHFDAVETGGGDLLDHLLEREILEQDREYPQFHGFDLTGNTSVHTPPELELSHERVGNLNRAQAALEGRKQHAVRAARVLTRCDETENIRQRVLECVRPRLVMAAGQGGIPASLWIEQGRILFQDLIGLAPVPDPQPVRFFLQPREAGASAVEFHAKIVLVPGAERAGKKCAGGAIVEAQERAAEIGDADFVRFRFASAILRKRFVRAHRLPARLQDGPQLRQHADHPQARDVLDEVEPVRSRVGDHGRGSALFRIEPPGEIGVVEQPLLQIVPVHEMNAPQIAAPDHDACLLYQGVVAVIEGPRR